jgi:hypothetical protein
VHGDCYRALVAETKAAVAAARKDGETVRLRAFVWLQGESDSNAKDAPFYAGRLAHMIDRLRHDLDSPELTALIAVNAQYGLGKRKYVPDIIAAQQAVAKKDAHAAYVDTSKASIANQSHFDAQGTLDVGRWFAEAMMELEGD